MYQLQKKEKAFTLVELAIVLVIVGLLIGGVLQGQELLKQARINKAVAQIKEFTLAHNAYKLKYNAIPGDHAKASVFISGVTVNGDGDKRVISLSANATGVNCTPGEPTNTEVAWYWYHLNAAKMINYNLISTNSSSFPQVYPEFELTKGGYIASTCMSQGEVFSGVQRGQYYILGINAPSINHTGTRLFYQFPNWNHVFGSRDIADGETLNGFDSKIDDGIPNSGLVTAMTGCAQNQSSYDFTCNSTLMYKWE